MKSTTKIRDLRYRARYKIAELLDRLPGQCWADLVFWVMGDSTSASPWSPSRTCREDMQRAGSCYCGKWRLPHLRDREGGIWSPDGQGTYTAFDGLFTGWRREDVDRMYGPVTEISESDVPA